MKPANTFLHDMLDLNSPEAAADQVWIAGPAADVAVQDGVGYVRIPFQAHKPSSLDPDTVVAPCMHTLGVRAYGPVVRLSLSFDDRPAAADSVMLEWDQRLRPEPLRVVRSDAEWRLLDRQGRARLRLRTDLEPPRPWRPVRPDDPPTPQYLRMTVAPEGRTAIAFSDRDRFFAGCQESLPLTVVMRGGRPHRVLFSLQAQPNEHFAGTGERFAKLDLAGRTLVLENTDALGVNNRRCYKNIPFFLSSRPYGLFIHTSAHIRLSLADISTRAAQGLIEDGVLDLFFIGGATPERILYNYRRLTGFPRVPPVWSFGTWMSRMSYFSAAEVRTVARRLRAEGFPCDVLHVDTGWFAKDWECDWEFSSERFPEPAAFVKELRAQGFRISLWQRPNIGENNKLRELACRERYVPPRPDAPEERRRTDWSLQTYATTLDFSNPATVTWYQGLLARLLQLGVGAIKTDFGEDIDMQAAYHGLPARLLHNLYALLYQKAAFEITARTAGEGIIWARAAWAGSQRYPVHWGGDAAGTWDGMAGTLRGGLHLGLSGFAFWSHDVPGFHGLPHFLASWPSDALYVRWTQFGVFSSHLRYHGAQPREPYEYPRIAPLVREWLKLRYALIPYLVDQSRKAARSGFPILRALLLHHPHDPRCWQVDDQFYCGDSLLVAPVMNDRGVRDVYLPAGVWRDLWTGQRLEGPRELRGVRCPLARLPVYAVDGACLRVYPLPVAHTGEMNLRAAVPLRFDRTFHGLARSLLGRYIKL